MRKFLKPFCPKNHDKRIEGITSKGQCRKCYNEQNRERHRKEVNKERIRRYWGGPPELAAYMTGLKQTREALGWTQDDLAFHVGCSRSTISRAENLVFKAPHSLQVEIAAVVVWEWRKRRGEEWAA